MASRWYVAATSVATAVLLAVPSQASPGSNWNDQKIRGLTIGPIESGLHPNKGYGSAVCRQTMEDARRMGATWVSLTPFGRVWDLSATAVDPVFEAPLPESRAGIERAVAQAHAEGLRVMLVPHLWVETGGWRALIDPGDDAGWKAWADGYRRFVTLWAEVAEGAGVDLFSVGVELRSWVTTTRAPSFIDVIRSVRDVYSGPITYAANWDDVEDTVILGELDAIGVNAFYPLASDDGASYEQLVEGGQRVAQSLDELARLWDKPIVLTEMGYTTREDPAVRPWEWPDSMKDVDPDPGAQADAYQALLGPLFDTPAILGFFVWRVYADPNDMSQEAAWGFSPRGKLAELVVRDAFAARWHGEGSGRALPASRATGIGRY